jgi:hypothetical protein
MLTPGFESRTHWATGHQIRKTEFALDDGSANSNDIVKVAILFSDISRAVDDIYFMYETTGHNNDQPQLARDSGPRINRKGAGPTKTKIKATGSAMCYFFCKFTQQQ